MSSRKYTAKLKGRDVELSDEYLSSMADMYVADAELRSRISELFWFHLAILDSEFGVSPHDVLHSIYELETGPEPSGTKNATPFNNLPLKGFWHKHYFSAHFVAQNIILGLGKKGLDAIIEDVMGPPDGSPITREMIEELAHRIPNDPLQSRDATKKLTGEWIIYLPHDGKNYYMCTAIHDAGDQVIYDRIMEHCPRDFPDLAQWVSEARTK